MFKNDDVSNLKIKDEKEKIVKKGESKEKSEKINKSIKSAFVNDSAALADYSKTTRGMLYVLIIILVITVFVSGIVNNYSYYGTYYTYSLTSTTGSGKTLDIDKLNKVKIGLTKITYYIYVEPSTSSYSSSTSTQDYYIKQGYEQVSNNWYKKSYKYKKIKDGDTTYLYVKKEDDWVRAFTLYNGRFLNGYYRKHEIKKFCRQLDIELE